MSLTEAEELELLSLKRKRGLGAVTANPTLMRQFANQQVGQQESKEMGFLNSRDPGIDYGTGIANAAFRAGFSRMDNDAEKAKWLDKNVGSGRWGKDSFGAYFLTPEGAKTVGVDSAKPISIDEQGTTRYDIADWGGDVPPILGALGGSMAATGAGLLPGMGMAALGSVFGKSVDELLKMYQGYHDKTAAQTGIKLLKEGGQAAGGELLGRTVGAVVKRALAPEAHRLTPESLAAAKAAQEEGFYVRPGAVTDAPLLSRWEGMVRSIFGDLYEGQNKAAAQAGLEKLGAASGKSVGKEAAGVEAAESIIRGRKEFGISAANRYKQVDALSGGSPIVPTSQLKKTANEILESFPKTSEGKPVFASDKTVGLLEDIQKLPDAVTASQMQQVRTTLREAGELTNLTPDITKRHAKLLRQAAETSFDDAAKAGGASQEAVAALRAADQYYKEGIRKYGNNFVSKITKDTNKPGAVDPDQVVDFIIKPEHSFRIKAIKQAMSKEAWDKVKAAHAEDLLSNVMRQTDDPLKQIFDGRAMLDGLDKYGRNTLNEVHGKEWTDAAYKYARSLMLANKTTKMSGGIVAANIALHPIANLPKLLWIRGLAKVMEKPASFKYLTEGVTFGPSTKAGADALNKFFSQVLAQAEDETGSARVTFTEPR